MAGISVFKVLGDRQRRDILVLLKDGRLSAGEIAQKLGISPAALSYHLKLLKQADLVLEYKSGNFIFYEINTSVLQEVILWVQQFGGVHEKDCDVALCSSACDVDADRVRQVRKQ